MQAGVLIEVGDVHFSSPQNQNRGFIRLGFFAIPESKIEPGIRKLAEVISQLSPQK